MIDGVDSAPCCGRKREKPKPPKMVGTYAYESAPVKKKAKKKD
jgi:hypothetical protein